MAQWALSPAVLGTLSVVSLLLFFGSLAALPWLVARLPEDYFVEDGDPPSAILRSERAVATSKILRNIAGAVLVLAGIAMLVLPGQGVLTILMGLALAEFPGKRGLQRKLVARPRVLSALNRLRARAHKPPLRLE